MSQGTLLEVRNLKTVFLTDQARVAAVNDISFTIRKGEVLGLVGESGCGKSVTALSILRLLRPPGQISGGQILLNGDDLLIRPEEEMQKIRGNRISMIFQEPMTSLNPVMKIGDQIAESLTIHKKVGKKSARNEAIRLLKEVSIPDPESRINAYPHQLSGGMRQRVMIAMAIACSPELLIADEPTTALDVTIQAQILELLNRLRAEYGLSILLITHALGVIAETADRVLVMYAGRIVEEAPVSDLFANPCHPYTVGLLNSIPRIDAELECSGRLKAIEGTVPDLSKQLKGCSFEERCSDRFQLCADQSPHTVWITPQHRVECFKFMDQSESGTAQ